MGDGIDIINLYCKILMGCTMRAYDLYYSIGRDGRLDRRADERAEGRADGRAEARAERAGGPKPTLTLNCADPKPTPCGSPAPALAVCKNRWKVRELPPSSAELK